jgi:hypothetical protein
MSFIFASPVPLISSEGRYQEKERTENLAVRKTAKYLSSPNRYRMRKLPSMRDEVIQVDSTHHAIGKIGQHVCSGMEVGWHQHWLTQREEAQEGQWSIGQ